MARDRIIGLDVARGLAVMGMAVVNYQVIFDYDETAWPLLQWLTDHVHGRAAALFVILSGAGISLLTARSRVSGKPTEMADARRRVMRRAVFLGVGGLVFATCWSPDILHFHAAYFALALLFLYVPDSVLLRGTGAVTVGAAAFAMAPARTGVPSSYLSLADSLGSLDRLAEHYLFSGLHPVLPWAGYVLFGMWLGRQNLGDPALRRRMAVSGGAVFVLATGLRKFCEAGLGDGAAPFAAWAEAALYSGTDGSGLLYLASSGGIALVVAMSCVGWAAGCRESKAVAVLAATGKTALTLYVAHVFFADATALLLDGCGVDPQLPHVLGSVLLFGLSAAAASAWWCRRYRRGPLEAAMRRFAD
ncbi:MAG: heparan-alpha-glucosaminide N-acetyltransferase domain-containing protein [Desulfatibacillaceae bacterium]